MNKKPRKRTDECLFCSSRSCHTRIVRETVPYYDEIACDKHVKDLEKHSDQILGKGNGVIRLHMTGNRKYKRGETI